MMRVRGLSVRIGAFTLDGIDLEVKAGECLAILGPSGAGKTLLLETLMGARHAAGGELLLGDRDLAGLSPEDRGIAYIPQDLSLFPHLSVRENIVFGLPSRRLRRTGTPWMQEIVSILGIARLLDRPRVDLLSGGERQRIALARALVLRPRVLFLDEPLASVDQATRLELVDLLVQLREELGTAMVYVTHDLAEARALAHNVAVLIQGRLCAYGPAEEVFDNPGTVDAARFLLYRNLIPAEAMPALLRSAAPHAGPQVVAYGLRPEHVRVRPGEACAPGWISGVLVRAVTGAQKNLVLVRTDSGVEIAGCLAAQETCNPPTPADIHFPVDRLRPLRRQ